MQRYPLACLFLAAALELSGCGGEPGAREEQRAVNGASKPAGVTEVRITGTATKGVLRHAAVTAYALDEDGERRSVVGSTETDESGQFSLNLEPVYDGVIELEVSAIQGRTTMLCDASRCGMAGRFEELPLPAGFTLTALVEEPQRKVNTSISVWSSMAAQRAKAIRADDPTISLEHAVRQAYSEVSQVVGFKLAETESRGISQLSDSDPIQAQYAIMNGAAAELLFWSDASNWVEEIKKFTGALADNGVIGSGSENFTLGELAGAIRHVINNTPDLDDVVVESLANQIAQFDLDKSRGFAPGFNRAFLYDAGTSKAQKIEKFQSFVTQIRTWVSSIEELDANQLAQAVSVDSETVQTVVNKETQSRFMFLGEVLDQVAAFIVANPHVVQDRLINLGYEDITIHNHKGHVVGNARLRFSDRNGLVVEIVGEVTGDTNHTFLPFELLLSTSIPISELEETENGATEDTAAGEQVVKLARLFTADHMALTGAITNGQGQPLLIIHRMSLMLKLNPAIQDTAISGANLTGLFRSAFLLGEVAINSGGASFTGSVDLGLSRLGAGRHALEGFTGGPLWTQKLRLAGDFVSANGSKSFSSSVMANIKTSLAPDAFAWAEQINGYRLVHGTLEGIEGIYEMADPIMNGAVLPSFVLRADLNPDKPKNGTVQFAGYSATEEERAAFRRCVADLRKVSNWPYLLAGDSAHEEVDSPTANDLQNLCADANLKVHRQEKNLNEAQVEQIGDFVREKLAAKLGHRPEMLDEITLDRIWGYAKDGSRNGYYVAAVNVPQDRGDFSDQSLTISSRVDIPELRTAHVSATVNRTSHRGGYLRANVKWDGGSYTAVLSVDDVDDPQQLNARLFNAQGYELNILVGRDETGEPVLDGEAVIDGTKIGYVTLRDDYFPLIVYPDGERKVIESLY